jgi:hypothetical protein
METIMKNRKEKQGTWGVFTDIDLQKGLLLLITVMLLFVAIPVSAQEKSEDDWEFGLQVYLWGATVKGDTVTGDPILFTFGTILKNLDMAAMTTFDARKDKFSMLTDVIYMNLGDSQKHEGEFLGRPIEGKLDVGLKAWVLNLIGGYNLIDTGKNQFDIAAGARYLDLTVDTTVKPNDNKQKFSDGGSTWDGVVGIKGRHNYPDGHYFNYYADVGGGNSKLTWQAAANFAYDYKKFTGIVGYRYLKWNFKNDAPALDDLTLHGPYIAAKWTW